MSNDVIFIGAAWLIAFLAVAILAMRIFYPHHRMVAVVIYVSSWVPFCYSLRLHRLWLETQGMRIQSITERYPWHILGGVALLLFLYTFFLFAPPKKSPLLHLSDEELKKQIEQDVAVLLFLHESLNNVLNRLIVLHARTKKIVLFTASQKQEIMDAWGQLIEILFELDIIKQRYRSFAYINGFRRPTLHAKAFFLAYSAFLTQYTHVFALANVTGDSSSFVQLLNDELTTGGKKNVYFTLRQHLTHPHDLLRLNAGRVYAALMRKRIPRFPLIKCVDTCMRTIDTSLSKYSVFLRGNPLDYLEKRAFTTWFPLQRGIALQLSYIRTAVRPYLISPTLLASYQHRLTPGDIVLQRREWHATNIGIPGYWTHAALYIGSLQEMDEYFGELPSFKESTASEIIRQRFPIAYDHLQATDEHGYIYRIIESKRPGVIFTSLEESAGADSLAVLRVRVRKQDRFSVILAALPHLGKPYDYNFDFRTDNALVCSELVYKAYQGVKGLTLQTRSVNGRPVFPPNAFAQKFDEEYDSKNQQLDLVLFLDGNEVKRTAVERDVAEFRQTWKRPKWHILKDRIPKA